MLDSVDRKACVECSKLKPDDYVRLGLSHRWFVGDTLLDFKNDCFRSVRRFDDHLDHVVAYTPRSSR